MPLSAGAASAAVTPNSFPRRAVRYRRSRDLPAAAPPVGAEGHRRKVTGWRSSGEPGEYQFGDRLSGPSCGVDAGRASGRNHARPTPPHRRWSTGFPRWPAGTGRRRRPARRAATCSPRSVPVTARTGRGTRKPGPARGVADIVEPPSRPLRIGRLEYHPARPARWFPARRAAAPGRPLPPRTRQALPQAPHPGVPQRPRVDSLSEIRDPRRPPSEILAGDHVRYMARLQPESGPDAFLSAAREHDPEISCHHCDTEPPPRAKFPQ
jgi:hypothetical protein